MPFNSTYSPLQCDVCGNSIRILLPCSITSLAMVARAFEDAHAECAGDEKRQDVLG